MLIIGRQRTYSAGSLTVWLGMAFGVLKEESSSVLVTNRVFEMILCNTFIAKDEEKQADRKITGVLPYDVVRDGRFDMEFCLRKFAGHYQAVQFRQGSFPAGDLHIPWQENSLAFFYTITSKIRLPPVTMKDGNDKRRFVPPGHRRRWL